MSEKRNSSRRRVLKVGTIVLKSGGGISCRVRDLSETGACLEVASQFGIPDGFTLQIEGDHIQRPSRVAWRKDKRIGISFG
jgi:hypothetical protein